MWWWEFVYPAGVIDGQRAAHPHGRPVRLTLKSMNPGCPRRGPAGFAAGVIHSFWVPKLAGKQDVVPGRENKMTLIAEEPGSTSGSAPSTATSPTPTCASG